MKIEFDEKRDYFIEQYRDGRWQSVPFDFGGMSCSHCSDFGKSKVYLKSITDVPARLMDRVIRETHQTTIHYNDFKSSLEEV